MGMKCPKCGSKNGHRYEGANHCDCCNCHWTDWQQEEINTLTKERDHYKNACIKISYDVEQTLGKALDYPWYKDDPKNFPDATEADGVCTGEHVPESLAIEATKRIDRLEKEIIALKGGLHKAERIIWARSDTYWICCGGKMNIDSQDNFLGHTKDCWLAKLIA